MAVIGSIEFTVFSNNHIEPTMALINDIKSKMNDLGNCEFLPSIVVEQKLDPLYNRIASVNSLVLNSFNHRKQICCMNDWVSVRRNARKIRDEVESIDITEFFTEAEAMLCQLMETNNIYSNRLAINLEIISDVISEDFRKTPLGERMFRTLGFYDDSIIEEWSTRVNSRRTIQIEHAELLNVINDISVVTDRKTSSNRFLCHLDINTAQENAAYRFAAKDLKGFADEVIKIIDVIRSEFEVALDEESCQ